MSERIEPRRPIPREQNCAAVHAAADAVAALRRAATAFDDREQYTAARRLRRTADEAEEAARDGAAQLGVSWNGRRA